MRNKEILVELLNISDCLHTFEGYNEHVNIQGKVNLKIAITCADKMIAKLTPKRRQIKWQEK